jgi:hypothetical protein
MLEGVSSLLICYLLNATREDQCVHCSDTSGQHEMAGIEELIFAIDAEMIQEKPGYCVVDRIADEMADPTRRPVFPPIQSRKAMATVLGGSGRRDLGRSPGPWLSHSFAF